MSKCIVCGAVLGGKPVLCMPNAPACAQDLPDRETLGDDRGIDLNLHQCRICGLIQLDCEPVPYYRDVIRAVGYSETMMRQKRAQYAEWIGRYQLGHKKIIEIGCGQGEYLTPLTEFPVEAYGIEHRESLVQLAQERGLNVWRAFPETADTVLDHAPFDAFVIFNFLEHQPDPNAMLQCIYNNLTEDGIGLVTVPAFEYVLERNAFYELVRDHIAYYTAESFRFLMEHNGFAVLEQDIIEGGTLRAVVRKRPQTDLSGFRVYMDTLQERLSAFAADCRAQGKRVAVWGASHMAFAVLSFTELGKAASYIIDSAPFKQGKFAPASHVPIVAPEHYAEEPVQRIVIVAPSYAAEIAETARARFGSGIEVFSLNGIELERV